MKKFLSAALAAVMLLSLAACGSKDNNSGNAAGSTGGAGKDTIVFAQDLMATTLDPYADTNTTTNAVLDFIYDTLWKMEPDGSLTPRLATEWEWVDDTHLSVTLREGVVFSNGNPFTADDVVYTLNYAAASPLSANFAKIDFANTVVADDTHLTIAFSSVDPTFMTYTGMVAAGSMMDKETCEADASAINAKPVGTGRYTLDKWVSSDSMTFSANDKYWGEDVGLIKNIVVRQISEATQRAIELQSGGVDYIIAVNALDIDTLQNDPKYTVISEPSTMIHMLFFNENGPMGNEDLRKAVAYCISNQDIVNGVFSGVGQAANSTVSPVAIGYADKLSGGLMYEQDFEKAKQHLAAAGYADGLTIRAIVNEGEFVNEFEIIKNELAQIGITLNVDTYDFTTALTYALDKSGDWDLYMLANGAQTAALQLAWFDKDQGAPFAMIPDEALFAILSQLYVTTDADKQLELGVQAQIYQMEHVTVYPLVVTNQNVAFVSNLKNVTTNIDQMPDMSKIYFE